MAACQLHYKSTKSCMMHCLQVTSLVFLSSGNNHQLQENKDLLPFVILNQPEDMDLIMVQNDEPTKPALPKPLQPPSQCEMAVADCMATDTKFAVSALTVLIAD